MQVWFIPLVGDNVLPTLKFVLTDHHDDAFYTRYAQRQHSQHAKHTQRAKAGLFRRERVPVTVDYSIDWVLGCVAMVQVLLILVLW